MKTALVSVIIPSHNRPMHILKAVTSVLQQTYPHLEVIVVDDGSTHPITLPLEDARVRLLRNETARGVAAARNQGLQAAHGEYLCFLDDDDFYYPDKLARQVTWLNMHPETDMVVSQVEYVYQDGRRACYGHSVNWLDNFKAFNTLHTNCSLFRRRILDRVYFDERMTKYTDTQFYLAACLRCHIDYLPGAVAVWNVDGCTNRITAPRNYGKSYRNFKLLCENFSSTIDSNSTLRYQYYYRLMKYALITFHFMDAAQSFMKMLALAPRSTVLTEDALLAKRISG